MKLHLLIIALFVCFNACHSQTTPDNLPKASDEEFDQIIKKYLDFSIPVISVNELYKNYNNYILLDAREDNEYETSHLPGAIHIGYENIQWNKLASLNKSDTLVLYCAIGYRSEIVANKLKKKGYVSYNLYGSIFEWVNSGYPVHDNSEEATSKIHGYNKDWSQWIKNKNMEVSY